MPFQNKLKLPHHERTQNLRPMNSSASLENVTDLRQIIDLRRMRVTLFILALLYAFAAGLRTLGDFDLGWQLATGRWIVQHGHIPFTDVFSYTASGTEWIYPVLSQILLYLSYVIGGYSLLSWLGAAACVTTVALLLRRSSLTGVILAIVSVPLIAACTPPRAEMFTAVLFAAYVNLLWHYHQSGEGPLWLLPVLMCLWVNLHLGFIAGLAMCGAYILLELEDAIVPAHRPGALLRLKKAVPWLIATLAATIVNPWGWRIYTAIARQGSIAQTHSMWIWEWQGLRLTPRALAKAVAWGDPESAVLWLIFAACIAVLCALAKRNLVAALLLASSIYLVIHAIRMEACFACITVVVGGTVLSQTLSSVYKNRIATRFEMPARSKALAAIMSVVLITCFVGIRSFDLITNRLYLRTPFAFSIFGAGQSWWAPEQAAAFVLKEHLPRNLFNDFNSGGFAVWKLSPAYPDYIDGRSVPFGGSLLLRNSSLLEESLDSEAWSSEADTRGINTILLSVDYEAGNALRSLGSYCDAQRWRPVFLDAFGAVFLRVAPETTDLVHRLQIDCRTVQFADPPVAASGAEQFRYLLNAGTILVVLDRNAEAMQRLEKAERIFADNAFLHYAKGIALGNMGYAKDSEQELVTSVKLGSTDDAPAALARIYDQEGRYAEEAEVLRSAADRSNRSHWLYLMLGKVELRLGHADLALAAFQNAERESPFRGEAYALGEEFRSQIAAGKQRAMQIMTGR
ncbi:MAG: tetratricopeptide repeat protein [Terriglobales bacterium]